MGQFDGMFRHIDGLMGRFNPSFRHIDGLTGRFNPSFCHIDGLMGRFNPSFCHIDGLTGRFNGKLALLAINVNFLLSLSARAVLYPASFLSIDLFPEQTEEKEKINIATTFRSWINAQSQIGFSPEFS